MYTKSCKFALIFLLGFSKILLNGGFEVIKDDLYEDKLKMNENLPIVYHKVTLHKDTNGIGGFECHWHDKIELLYFVSGEALIRCNNKSYHTKSGDLIVVNSNELHQGTCIIDPTLYYCIIFDTSLLENRYIDLCQAKFLNAINENKILFQNLIEYDADISRYFNLFVNEIETKNNGYELMLKASIYIIIGILLRKYTRATLTINEYENRVKDLKKFNIVFKYMENHFSEKIYIDDLCSMVGLSRFHFCRSFKNIAGQTLTQYLNAMRIDKAALMLKNENRDITDVAALCGFNDSNYFCKVFRKYKNMSPSEFIKKISFEKH